MTTNIITDITRSIERLDTVGDIDPLDTVLIDGLEWPGAALLDAVAHNLAHTIRGTVVLRRVSRRDVSLMLSAHGMSPFGIHCHAAGLARRIRAHADAHGSWVATV